ncbi:MAG: acyltransferase [Potamolinea sp.]
MSYYIDLGEMESYPSKNIHVKALDGWRGVACLFVFFTHSGVNLHVFNIPIYGAVGVHLFFVLSGYLLYKPFIIKLLEQNTFPSFSKFYIRRFLRIYPPYLLALVFFILLRYISKSHPPEPFNIFTHLILISNYLGSKNFFSINAVFWTLTIEAQFYLLLPLTTLIVYKLTNKEPRKSLIITVLLMLFIGVIARATEFFLFDYSSPEFPNPVRFRSVFSFLDLFGFGMLTAYLEYVLSSQILKKPRYYGNVTCTIGILVFIATNAWFSSIGSNWMLIDNPWAVTLFPVFSCLAISVILLSIVTWRNYMNKILSLKPIVLIGEVSYSLYLYHMAVQLLVAKFLLVDAIKDISLHNYVLATASFFPTIIISVLMYRLVEKPSLALVARFR